MARSGLESGSRSQDSCCVQLKVLTQLATSLAPAPLSHISGSPNLRLWLPCPASLALPSCVPGSPVPCPRLPRPVSPAPLSCVSGSTVLCVSGFPVPRLWLPRPVSLALLYRRT